MVSVKVMESLHGPSLYTRKVYVICLYVKPWLSCSLKILSATDAIVPSLFQSNIEISQQLVKIMKSSSFYSVNQRSNCVTKLFPLLSTFFEGGTC